MKPIFGALGGAVDRPAGGAKSLSTSGLRKLHPACHGLAITKQSLATVPYDVGAAQIVPAGTVHRNEHIVYTCNAARVDVVDAPNTSIANLRTVTGTPNAAGTTVYLPYEDNKITSVRLPTPTPATVNIF